MGTAASSGFRDVENEYVTRWLAYERASKAVSRRQRAEIARRRRELVRRQPAVAIAKQVMTHAITNYLTDD